MGRVPRCFQGSLRQQRQNHAKAAILVQPGGPCPGRRRYAGSLTFSVRLFLGFRWSWIGSCVKLLAGRLSVVMCAAGCPTCAMNTHKTIIRHFPLAVNSENVYTRNGFEHHSLSARWRKRRRAGFD